MVCFQMENAAVLVIPVDVANGIFWVSCHGGRLDNITTYTTVYQTNFHHKYVNMSNWYRIEARFQTVYNIIYRNTKCDNDNEKEKDRENQGRGKGGKNIRNGKWNLNCHPLFVTTAINSLTRVWLPFQSTIIAFSCQYFSLLYSFCFPSCQLI